MDDFLCHERFATADRLELNRDCFGLGVEVDGFVSHFATPARLLVTSKWQGSIKDVVAVDPYIAGSYAFCHFVSAADITLFLDMMAVERGASTNTLEAYRRDLSDFSDDLTDLTYDDQGVFFNLIGKF